jgi:hypothetical protein
MVFLIACASHKVAFGNESDGLIYVWYHKKPQSDHGITKLFMYLGISRYFLSLNH